MEKQDMVKIKAIHIPVQQDLTITQQTLDEAGLTGRLKLVIQKGEIRILPEVEIDPLETLEALAGCLGEEPATAYDFSLKIGSLYEAR